MPEAPVVTTSAAWTVALTNAGGWPIVAKKALAETP
jgi:hypothetical protein